MAAVAFGPDRGRHRSRPRTGLVLGAGGVLGAAWMTGALACLQERLPYALGDVDVIVGTSAGSVLAAALRCGTSVQEMVAWQRGEVTGALSESAALAAQDGPLPPLPYPRFGSVPLARAALLAPRRVPPWVGASALLPHGRGQHVALRSLIEALLRRHDEGRLQAWFDGDTWLAAVDYDTGQSVFFGREGAPPACVPDAVVASCSIPGWHEPQLIGGRRYVDGGVRSVTSLSALSGENLREVYVLAPMASIEIGYPLQAYLRIERPLRQMITHSVLRQARALSAQGMRVTVLTPGHQDLSAMGINLMDGRRKEAVLEASFVTSADALGRLDRAA
jgi:NTE family protein